jgi:hypothetical protein
MSNYMSMFAPAGHQVRLSAAFIHRGYDHEIAAAHQYLQLGTVYTVKRTRVFASHSKVELEEVPGRSFNTIHFESLTPLSDAEELALEEQYCNYLRAGGRP